MRFLVFFDQLYKLLTNGALHYHLLYFPVAPHTTIKPEPVSIETCSIMTLHLIVTLHHITVTRWGGTLVTSRTTTGTIRRLRSSILLWHTWRVMLPLAAALCSIVPPAVTLNHNVSDPLPFRVLNRLVVVVLLGEGGDDVP